MCSSSHHRGTSTPTQATTHPPHLCTSIGSSYHTLKREEPLNVQVACTHSGHLAWMSDPHDGTIHDAEALRRCGLLDVPATDLPDEDTTAPCRQQGVCRTGHDHPEEKIPHLALHPNDRTYNRTVNQIRYKVERVITNSKHGAS